MGLKFIYLVRRPMIFQSRQHPHANSFRYSSVAYSLKVWFLKGKIRRNYYALKKDTPVKRSIASLENEIFGVKKGVKSGDTVFQIPSKFLNPDRTYILFQFFRPAYATENKIHNGISCTDFSVTKSHIGGTQS